MTSWTAMALTLMIASQSVVKILLTSGNPVVQTAEDISSPQHAKSDEDDSHVARLVKCGFERCPLHRTFGSYDLLHRCLEERCVAALSQDSENLEAGKEKKLVERRTMTSTDCAEACEGGSGSEYLECLSQSCGINKRRATSVYCPSVCRVVSPDNLEQCIQRYCPVIPDQEDQGGEWSETAEQGDETEKRWGNRLNWMKKWGHRVGREYGGETPLKSKRWGSRVCLQAHCGSLANNRHAYVACGQNFCSGRR